MLRISFIIISILMCIKSYAQVYTSKYQILYNFTYQRDSTNKATKKSEVMELLVHDSLTVYQSLNKGLRDSMLLARGLSYNNGTPPDIMNATEHNLRFSIFKNYGPFLVQHNYTPNNSDDKTYKYYKDDISLEWELMGVDSTISGIGVQKAITKTKNTTWEAWFATEIPISAGPYKFHGLPGLIVKLQDVNHYWTFEMQEINPKSQRKIQLPDSKLWAKNLITKQDLIKERKYYIENATLIDIANKLIVVDDENFKIQLMNNDKKRAAINNLWIETEI